MTGIIAPLPQAPLESPSKCIAVELRKRKQSLSKPAQEMFPKAIHSKWASLSDQAAQLGKSMLPVEGVRQVLQTQPVLPTAKPDKAAQSSAQPSSLP